MNDGNEATKVVTVSDLPKIPMIPAPGAPGQWETHTDCRTDEGITVGLIDAVINLARVLRTREWDHIEIQEALKDLRQDEDVAALLGK